MIFLSERVGRLVLYQALCSMIMHMWLWLLENNHITTVVVVIIAKIRDSRSVERDHRGLRLGRMEASELALIGLFTLWPHWIWTDRLSVGSLSVVGARATILDAPRTLKEHSRSPHSLNVRWAFDKLLARWTSKVLEMAAGMQNKYQHLFSEEAQDL